MKMRWKEKIKNTKTKQNIQQRSEKRGTKGEIEKKRRDQGRIKRQTKGGGEKRR